MKTTVGKRTKTLRWIAVSLGILLILLLGFLALAPRLISMESVRERVVRLLSDKMGVEVDLRSLELSYLPFPHVQIEHAKITLPGRGSGTLGSVSVYPRILPLLRGKAEISRIEIGSPDLKISLPKGKKEGPAGVPIHLALAPLALGEPDLELELSDGRLELVREGGPSLSFKDISLELVLPPEGYTFRVSCVSSLWQRLSLNGHLDVQTFKGSGQMDVRGFQPQRLMESVNPEGSLRMEGSMLDLGVTAKMDGLRGIQAQIRGSLPEVTLIRKGRRTTIKAGRFTGSAGTGDEGIQVSLKEFSLDQPRLGLSGEFILAGGEKPFRVQLEAKDVDVPSVRETVLALAGDDPDVAGVFNMVRGGRTPTVTCQAEGRSLEELLDLDRMVIAGRMEEGRIFVPGADLDLQDVKGQAVIRKGNLEGTDLEARYGNTTGRDGKLGLGLRSGDAPFHLDIQLDADLTQLPPVFKRFVENKAFLSELEKIRVLQGRAKGKLVLGEKTADIRARVEVSEFNLTARHEGFPYPVKMQGGHYFYEGTAARVGDLRCQAGKSSVGRLSGTIDWKGQPGVDIACEDTNVSVGEVFAWLSSLEDGRHLLRRISSAEGNVLLSKTRIKGPLLNPEKWRFDASGEIKGLKCQADFLPGTVEVSKGRFTADQERLALKDIQTSLMDTSLGVSGSLNGYMQGLQKADLDFAGEIGIRTIEEYTRFSWRGRQVRVRSPLSLEPMHLTWEDERSIALQGVAVVRNGPSITVDVRREPGRWLINRILLQDKDSNADFSLQLRDREMTLSFSGKLNETTMDRIFPGYESQYCWVEGDIRVHLVQDRLDECWARGKVAADDFSILHFLHEHVNIDRIALKAEERRIEIETAVFTWAETRFSAAGSLEMKPEGLLVNLDFHSSMLDWEQIKPYLPTGEKQAPVKEEKRFSDIPLRGEVRLHTDHFTAGEFTWSPLKAGARFGPKGVEAKVTEARVCGVSTLGALVVTPEGLSLRFEALSDQLEVSPCVECFTQGKRKATGVFDLKLEAEGRGREEELLSSLRGNLVFTAKKGSILEHILFERINRYLSLTELFRSKDEFGKDGIPYDAILIKAKIENGRCVFQEAVFDGVDMEIGFEGQVNLVDRTIDGRMLVAPFRTVDRIVKFIPLVRTILGGTLVSIPIKVAGPLDDPKLTPLDPSAVGAGLLNVMKRTFNLPVQMFDPLIHKRERGGQEVETSGR